MSVDKLQRQRFENKYVIDEHRALAIRDFTSSFMQVDEYGAKQPNLSYPVHSLYFDSPDLILVQNTINGDRNRFKLRIRFYENMGDAPVYFEIKRRHNSVIAKKRASVRRSAAAMVAAGQISGSGILTEEDMYHQRALEEFTRLRSQLNAGPVAHVTYLREAWMGFDGQNFARLTMDRQVYTEPCKTLDFNPQLDNPVSIFGNKVILELKFTNRYPHWFRDLIQIFDLRQGPAAKYVDGVTKLGEHRFHMAYI